MKKLAAALLTGIVVMGIIGCGNTTDTSQANTSSGSGASETKSEALETESEVLETVYLLESTMIVTKDGGSYLSSSYTYNENGDKATYTSYSDQGTVEAEKEEYIYDESRNCIKAISSDYENDTTTTYEAIYDENGNRTIYITYDSNGEISEKIISAYDEDGNIISEEEYEADTLLRTTEYVYDSSTQNLIKEMNYDSDHEISSWYEYEYDDNGNMISSTFTYENGGSSAYSRFEWTYDDDGNKLTETNLTKDGEISNFYEYSYDNGKMITKKYYYYGELQSTSTYTYTDFGKVDTCTTDKSGETTTKKYTYITMELPVGWTESD